MATEINTMAATARNVFLAFLLGAVLVAVGIVGFFMWDNYKSHAAARPAGISVTVKK